MIPFEIVDFDVGETRVNAESEIRRKCPGCGSPGEERGGRVIDEGKGNRNFQ